MIKNMLILMTEEVTATEKLKSAITGAGTGLTGIISTAAGALSLLITSAAGLALLILCIITAFKARGGNQDAWGDAMQTIALIAAVLCFSTSISSLFF